MNRVRMLMYFGVTPYIVFDGGILPSKVVTEEARAARREESKKAGLRLYHTGRVSQAHQELQKAVDVTPYMARVVIEELKKLKVQYVVAPYEADSQLVYLEKQALINGIISEDSDMLVFGAKRLLSKLDQHGDCIELNRCDFTSCRDISLIGWTDESFRQMCILSGCDYLASIPGMGLKTAYRYMRKYKSAERVVKMVKFDGKSRVPVTYLEDFKRAELTFLHQRVFCPTSQKLVTLTPLPPNVNEEEMSFIGQDMSPEDAIAIAYGEIDPITMEPIVVAPAYPERQRMVLDRRQTLPSTTEKKPNPSITSYFTPKRVPLSELSANSLTPSPNQQQILEENSNRSWTSRAAPTHASSARSFSTPGSRFPLSVGRHTSVQRESSLSGAAPTPQSQRTKRQRLCSDMDTAVQVELGAETKSRFFPTPKTGGNGTPQGKINRARKSKFGVFSDDNVEDIMGQPPNGKEVPSTPGSLAFEETTPCQRRMGHADRFVKDTSCPQLQKSPPALGNTLPNPPDFSTTAVSTPPSISADLDRALHDQWGRRSPASLKRPASPEECHLRANVRRNTPLQRLGNAALGRSKSMNTLDTRASGETDRKEPGSDFDATTGFSLVAKGSEDMIVPDSQDEDADELEEPESPKPRVFDVRKFVFSDLA